MSTNYSIVGKEAQKLSIFNKIGVGLFILGIVGLIRLITMVVEQKTSLTKVDGHQSYLLVSFGLMLIGSFFFTYDRHHFSFYTFYTKHSNTAQKIGMFLGVAGFTILGVAWAGIELEPATAFLWGSLSLMGAGIVVYTIGSYAGHTKGIKNNFVFFNSLTSRGALGWVAGILLTLFYIQLYWLPETLESMTRMFDPLSYLITGKKASRWFVYGTIYTFLIFFLGIKFIVKYRHNRYQIVRTISVIFFQVVFAYALPHILESFHEGTGYFQKDLKQVWPLNYYFVDQMKGHAGGGVSGTFFFVWAIFLFLVITPVLTYLVGKRWYCSWVCGCGGLAETAGDGFRQLSSKKESAWKIERWVIHSVMVFVLAMTIAVLWPYFSGKEYELELFSISEHGFFYFWISVLGVAGLGLFNSYRKHKHNALLWGGIIIFFIAAFLAAIYNSDDLKEMFTLEKSYYYYLVIPMALVAAFMVWAYRNTKTSSYMVGAVLLMVVVGFLTYHNYWGENEAYMLKSKNLKKVYGFIVGAAFSGVIGVGFYPLLGSRVWCRFGCPMAGYMGIFQRFKSRFRITTNGSQCISCGNCSTYCEQGIDVRAYAQKGENIVRASCVGCGICSAVCPRGVLKLENGPEKGRFDSNPLIIDKDGVKLNM